MRAVFKGNKFTRRQQEHIRVPPTIPTRYTKIQCVAATRLLRKGYLSKGYCLPCLAGCPLQIGHTVLSRNFAESMHATSACSVVKVCYPLTWRTQVKQIKLFGLGGQGIVTAAKVFAKAVAIGEGKNAMSIPAYGHERRGAPVYSDLIISDEHIKLHSFVYEPDVVVIFDLSVIDKGVDVMAGTSKDTLFVINSPTPPASSMFEGHNVKYVNARKIALDVLKLDIPNTTMLGAMAGAGLCSLAAVKEAVVASFAKAGELNAQAAERGHNELK